jgi:hypothetical protein
MLTFPSGGGCGVTKVFKKRLDYNSKAKIANLVSVQIKSAKAH